MIRIAALHGLAAMDGAAAIPLLEKELGSANADVQAAAIRLLNRMPGAERHGDFREAVCRASRRSARSAC